MINDIFFGAYHSYCGQPTKRRGNDGREENEQIGCSSQGSWLRLCWSLQGCGIAPAHLQSWSSPPCTQDVWSTCLTFLRSRWAAVGETDLLVPPLDPAKAYGGVPNEWEVHVFVFICMARHLKWPWEDNLGLRCSKRCYRIAQLGAS